MYKLYTIDNNFIEEVENCPDNFTGMVELESGAKFWYKNGWLHREDGPAVIHTDGNQYWHKNGLLHREDGPAIIWCHLAPPEYYIMNKKVSKKEHRFLSDLIKLKGLTF